MIDPALLAGFEAQLDFDPHDPHEAFDRCKDTSDACAAWMQSHGMQARRVQVAAPVGLDPSKALTQWKRYIESGVAIHHVTVVDRWVVDWTMRQFDHEAPVPAVYELNEIQLHWQRVYPA